MNRSKNVYALLLLTAGIFFLNSCKKESLVKDTTDKAAQSKKLVEVANVNIQSYTVTQDLMLGIVQYGSQHFKTEGGFLAGFPCATVTKDTLSSPHTATVDFGTGCTNADGKFMSGSITVEYLDKDFKAPGNYYRATFTNFVDDYYQISGTMQLSYSGYQLSGNEGVLMESNLNTNLLSDHLQFTGRNHFNIEFSPDTVNDSQVVTTLTGNGNGTLSDGTPFTQTVTSALVERLICKDHFTQGTLLIQSPGFPDKEVDYGTGTCDDQATVTESGTTTTITLPKQN